MASKHVTRMIDSLRKARITKDDAYTLRRISMALHRWHELECGTGDNATFYIERDENDVPHLMRSDHTGLHDLGRIPDRERGALKRLKKIMDKYPDLQAYVQGDPRGAALWILPAGTTNPHQSYTNGIAVYK